jgi:hypothetical protein
MRLEVAKISVDTEGRTDYCPFVSKIRLFRRPEWIRYL